MQDQSDLRSSIARLLLAPVVYAAACAAFRSPSRRALILYVVYPYRYCGSSLSTSSFRRDFHATNNGSLCHEFQHGLAQLHVYRRYVNQSSTSLYVVVHAATARPYPRFKPRGRKLVVERVTIGKSVLLHSFFCFILHSSLQPPFPYPVLTAACHPEALRNAKGTSTRCMVRASTQSEAEMFCLALPRHRVQPSKNSVGG